MGELSVRVARLLSEVGVFAAVEIGTLELYVMMLALLIVSFLIGVVAVLAGVGGGVLFVPLVSSLFPIHIDFVRGAGLMVALVGSVAAAPRLMKRRFSRLRISIPLALVGSIGSIIGARIGLLVPTDAIILVLGFFMLFVAGQTAYQAIRARRRSSDSAWERDTDTESLVRRTLSERITEAWGLYGDYDDRAEGKTVHWRARRIVPTMGLFLGIGMLGGMLGVGAGWANVPALTSIVGLPVKLAAATSGLIIVTNSSAAAWVYLGQGAIEPLIVVSALIGMIGGTRLGARFLGAARPQVVRVTVIIILAVAGIRTLYGVVM